MTRIMTFDDEADNPCEIIISDKAYKLALKSQELSKEHNIVIKQLFQELQKDNPDVSFDRFPTDQFGAFTGQIFS